MNIQFNTTTVTLHDQTTVSIENMKTVNNSPSILFYNININDRFLSMIILRNVAFLCCFNESTRKSVKQFLLILKTVNFEFNY